MVLLGNLEYIYLKMDEKKSNLGNRISIVCFSLLIFIKTNNYWFLKRGTPLFSSSDVHIRIML